MIFAGCSGDSQTVHSPQNHWKYGASEAIVMRCELISYGDVKSNGTYFYEFRLCSGDYDSFTDTGEGDFMFFKIGIPTEELVDGVYSLNSSDPKSSLTEAGYMDRTMAQVVMFTTRGIEIKKSDDRYTITFSLKDGEGIVASGFYDGEFAFSDQRPEPGVAVDGSTIKFDLKDEAELRNLDKLVLLLNNDNIASATVLATGTCANGTFSVMLPGSVESSLLIDAHDAWPSELTFVPSEHGSVKQSADVLFCGYSADQRKGKFILYDPKDLYWDQSFAYFYFDGNITVKGTVYDGMENIYDLTFVKGWNIVHYYCTDGLDGSLCLYVTTHIQQTAWEYVSEGY